MISWENLENITKGNDNTTYQNCWNMTKAVLRGICVALILMLIFNFLNTEK